MTVNGVQVSTEAVCPGGVDHNANPQVCTFDYVFLYQIASGPNNLVLTFSGLSGFSFGGAGVLLCGTSGASGNMLCTQNLMSQSDVDALGIFVDAWGGNLVITVPALPSGDTLTFYIEENFPDFSGELPLPIPEPTINIGGAILSPQSIAFGSQEAGSASAPQTVTLINSGAFTTDLTVATSTPTANFTSDGNCATLAPGSVCGFLLSFNPSTPASPPGTPTTGIFTVTDNSSAANEIMPLSGIASSPGVTISPSTFAFGSQVVGTTSSPQTFTITNSAASSASITVNSIIASVDNFTGSADFVLQQDGCSGNSIPPGGSCQAGVQFSPTFPGSITSNLSISDTSQDGLHVIELSGTANDPNAATSSVSALTFGSQPLNTSSATQTVTITNASSNPLTVVAVNATADFAVQNDNCTPVSPIAANTSCTVLVDFAPTIVGSLSGTLTVANDSTDGTLVILLSGIGTTSPIASFNPASVAFGNEPVGMTSGSQSVTLSNTGSSQLVISALAITGANQSDFVIQSNTTCSTTNPLAVGTNCTINIVFGPQAAGGRSASLSISDNALGSPQLISLSGSGTTPMAPIATLNPTSLVFGNELVGIVSGSKTVTLSNTGSAPLTISALAIAGTDQSDFVIQSNSTCSTTNPLGAGASCTINMVFDPQAAGGRSASLSISDNELGSPQLLALSGTGQDFTLTAKPASAAVAPGSTATYIITATPIGGFTGTLQISCSGAPSEATCAPAPGSVVLNGTSSAQVDLTVTTTAPSAASTEHLRTPPDSSLVTATILAYWLSLGVLVGLVQKMPRKRMWRTLGIAIFLFPACLSCGGGGSTGPGNPGTPAGNSALTVSAASSALNHSVSVTLMVQ